MTNKSDREKITFIQGFNDSDSKTLSENYPNIIVFSEDGKNIYKNGVSYTSTQNINSKNNSFIFDDNIISLDLDNDDILLSLHKNSIDTKRYFYTGINVPNLEWKTNKLNHYNIKNKSIKNFKTINDFLDNSTIYESAYNYCLFIESLEDNNEIIFIKINNDDDASITYKKIGDNDFTILSLSSNIQYDVTLGKGERLYISEVKNVNITSTTTSGTFNISGDLNFTDEDNNKFDGSNLSSLFKDSKVVDASKLILHNTLTKGCYKSMFEGCKELLYPPKLPITKLEQSCYESMFKGCTSLTTAPELPATTLKTNCYAHMFEGCSKLNYIKALFTTDIKDETNNYPYTEKWVDGVYTTGTFIKSNDWNIYDKNDTIKDGILGINGIPELWNDKNGYRYRDNFYNMYLTIECLSEPVILQWPSNDYDRIDYNNNNNYATLEYSYDRKNWETISSNTINKIQLNINNNHNKVYLRGNNNSYEQLSLGDYSNIIECVYDVTSTTENTKLFNETNNTASIFSLIEIDDVELNKVVNTYTFNTTGEHTVRFTLNDFIDNEDKIKTIPDNTFSGCTDLISIIIPNRVKLMGDNVFNGCDKLTSITCDSLIAPEISSETFNNIDTENKVKLYIPSGWDLNNINVPEFVDFGLPSRTLWATKNLGAQTEDEYGYYYQWASTYNNYIKEGNNFSPAQYNNTDAANLKANIIPGGIYDTATSFDKNYQMPSHENFHELFYNSKNSYKWCEHIKDTFGYKIYNNNDPNNYIFLPAAGNYNYDQNYNRYVLSYYNNLGRYGRYWVTEIHFNNNYAINLYFGEYHMYTLNALERFNGCSIRPIIKRTNDVNKYLWKKIFKNIETNKNINDNKGTFKVYGNIMSLFYGDDFKNKTEIPNNISDNLHNFFNNTNIVDISDLILPEDLLNKGWDKLIELMFKDCNHLNLENLPQNNLEITPTYNENEEETFELNLTNDNIYRKYIFENENGYQCFILIPVEWENHLIVNFDDEKWGNVFNIPEISKIKQNIILNDGCKYNLYETKFNCKNIVYKMSSI